MVRVVPYDPGWPRHFEAERRLLENVLAPWLQGGIHHIGAASVPGLAAKPIIDLWRERLAFRDALRADAALAAEYEALKLRLAKQHRTDVAAYTAGKRDFGPACIMGAYHGQEETSRCGSLQGEVPRAA